MKASLARSLRLLPAMFLLLAACSLNAALPALWPQQQSDIPADPAVTWGVLDNGVRYALMPHNEPPGRVSLRLYVNAGSLMEEENQRGLAHFLEHMAFNGTTHHEPDSMVEYFQRLGMGFGNDTNAHTSWDETVYDMELPDTSDGMMDDGMQTLRDYAGGMLLLQGEIDKERGIILSEKRDRDSVRYRIFVDSLNFLLPDSLIPRRMTIGLESVIKEANRDRFLAFYKKWYTPDRMIVVVVGDIEPDRAASFVKKYFSDLPANRNPLPDPDLGTIKPAGTVAKILREPESPSVDISISCIRQMPGATPDTKEDRRARLERRIANQIVSRRLEILSRGKDSPITEGAAYTFKWLNFVDCSEIDVTALPDRWKDAVALCEQQMRKALRYGFTDAEFAEAVANIRNDYEESVKRESTRKSSEICDEILGCLSDGNVFSSPETDLEIASVDLETITPESVLEALREAWSVDSRVIYAGGKLPEDASDQAALEAYRASQQVAVEAPAKVETEEFAYRDFGTPGAVTEGSEVTDLDIAQIRFANNVLLNIKPTGFEKNAVYVKVRFGNGMLTAPRDKPGLAMLAGMTFTAGGLEKHSADDIARIFAGRTVGVTFGVDPDSFVLNGSTSPDDLQSELDLMAAYFVAPGYREEALVQARKNIPQLYMQIEHTPEGVLQNKGTSWLSSGDYRFGFPEESELMALGMEDVRQWLGGPLADSRIEISIVGDVNPEAVIPMVARTFGALPERQANKPRMADARMVKLPAPGPKTFHYQTQLPKAALMCVWPTEDQWNVARTRRLSVLADIFADRLRVQLREKFGDAYSPYAYNSASDTYTGYGFLTCVSSVSPDKVDEASSLIRQIADDLATKGATQDELDRALKPLNQQLTQWRRNNQYWLGNVLAQCQEYPVRLDWARSMVKDFQSVTLDEINELAALYLGADHAIDIHVVPDLPEKTDAGSPAEEASGNEGPSRD